MNDMNESPMCSSSVIDSPDRRISVGFVDAGGAIDIKEVFLEPERCSGCGKLCISPSQVAQAAKEVQAEVIRAAMETAAREARHQAVEPIFKAALAQLRGRGIRRSSRSSKRRWRNFVGAASGSFPC